MTTLPDGWPLVDQYDDGIRPAGRPDECFYCRQRVGQLHGPECVIVTKLIELSVCAMLPDGVTLTGRWQLDEPHYKEPSVIEFRYNESTWCASNFISARYPEHDYGTVTWSASDTVVDPWEALTAFAEAQDKEDLCLCRHMSFKFVRVVDDTPRRQLKVPSELNPAMPQRPGRA